MGDGREAGGWTRGEAWCSAYHAPVRCAKTWKAGDISTPSCPSEEKSLGGPRTKRAASGMGAASAGLWRASPAMGG
jgi:hypothetical protein